MQTRVCAFMGVCQWLTTETIIQYVLTKHSTHQHIFLTSHL